MYDAEGPVLHSGDPACIVAALGERTPARYHYAVEDYSSSHGSRADIILVVNDDGGADVAVLETLRANTSSGNEFHREDFRPTQHCILKPAEFFRACATAIAAGQGGSDYKYECAFEHTTEMVPQKLPPWFTSCEDAAPTCIAGR